MRFATQKIQLHVVGGIVFFPEYPDEPFELLRKARLAMFEAQKLNETALDYQSSMEPDPRNLTLMPDLKNALGSKQLTWVYQPQYNIKQKRVVGGEMLIRWNHPRHGWIPPDKFISLAEQTDLIKKVTQEVILQAVDILKQWIQSRKDWKLSINVSANDLSDQGIINDIIKRLGDYTDYLTLEITETAIMHDVKRIIENVEYLKNSNVGTALDDYGTGYSSL